jgi:hypothetical protein
MKIPQLAIAAGLIVIVSTAAIAQVGPACQRLEAQLTALDRGNDDPGRAETVRRAEDAANRQQIEVDGPAARARDFSRSSARRRRNAGRSMPKFNAPATRSSACKTSSSNSTAAIPSAPRSAAR